MKKIVFLINVFLFSWLSNAQSEESKWVVGLSSSLLRFDKNERDRIQDGHNFQFPKINVVRYLTDGVSFDASITLGVVGIDPIVHNPFDYFSLDGTLRYDFNLSDDNFVPYVGLGGGLINAPSTIQNSKTSGTLNLTFGSTLWISNHLGVNAQSTYKNPLQQGQGIVNHIQISVGVVYSFSPRYFRSRSWRVRRVRY
ncbi:MAG: Uncharacterised protein [Flavobacterium sp. SCGC AAA160-P02]|nr:MAG: Uncharacterised protein [Flavobacterium sp. SCGC AAA160-P02]